MQRSTSAWGWAACGVVLALAAHGAAAPDVKPGPGASDQKPEVTVVRDVTYYEGEGADKVRHKLDLYLPKDKKDFPVLFFVHGGAWVMGDKEYFGAMPAAGAMLARHGVGVVSINYRLSPAVTHPEHVKDVARAFAWTHKNIQKYGGRADQVFVCGHSAGGHLVALLATDDSYLKAEGLALKDIKGAIPISGVYTLPGKMFESIFGKDAEQRKKAFPLAHARADAPPFLIVYAESDFPGCDKASEEFCKALKDKKAVAETLEVKKRNHISVFMNAVKDDDPCAQAILKFVAEHTKP